MQLPLQITFRNFPPSAAVEARIRAKAAKLEEFHPHIMSCHVVVQELDRHHHQGKQFTVRLDIRVPKRTLIVDRDYRKVLARSDRALVLQKGQVVMSGASDAVAADPALAGFLGV